MRAGRLSIVNKSDPMAPTHYILSAAVLPQPAAAISSRRLQLPPRRARPRMAILAGAPVCRRKIQNQLKSFLKEHFHLRRPPKFDKILHFLKIFPNKHQRKGKLSNFWGLFGIYELYSRFFNDCKTFMKHFEKKNEQKMLLQKGFSPN